MFDDKNLRGIFVVFYGGHNRGKTTQGNRVVEELRRRGKIAYVYKYPILSLEPSGPLIDSYVRGGNPYRIAPDEFQLLQVVNKLHAQREIIIPALRRGHWIIAEDYTGTCIAWTLATGLGTDFAKTIIEMHKTTIIEPNISFIFKGKRFIEAKEVSHVHESDDELEDKAHRIHLQLAKEYGWFSIQSDRSEEEVTRQILDILKEAFYLEK